MANVILNFTDGLFDHWWWLIGIVFMVEPLLDAHIAGYRAWADKYISREKRSKIFWSISLACLFMACFMAYRDEYLVAADAETRAKNELAEIEGADGKGGLKKQNSELNSQLTQTQEALAKAKAEKPREIYKVLPAPPVTVSIERPHRHLSPEQHKALVAGITPLKNELQGLVAFSEAGDSLRYLVDFLKAFSEAGLTVPSGSGSTDNDTDRGVMVGFIDPAHQSELGKAFVAVLRDANIDVHITTTKALAEPNLDFDLFICDE
jgi:hypothetical protein